MKRLPLLAAAACGLVLMGIGLLWQGTGGVETTRDWLQVLSNSALLAGVILTGVGALARISDEHFFDGIRYAVTSLFEHLAGKPKRYATYYDFIHREKHKSSSFSMLIPGLVFLGAAILLTWAYYAA